jgi:hypothetical protein
MPINSGYGGISCAAYRPVNGGQQIVIMGKWLS